MNNTTTMTDSEETMDLEPMELSDAELAATRGGCGGGGGGGGGGGKKGSGGES